MKRKSLKYFIVSIIGVLISISIFASRNLLDANNTTELVFILSDGFLVPGVLILGFGILVFVSNGGMFDVFTYSINKMRTMRLSGEKKQKGYKTFYDYRMSKEKAPCAFLIIIGGVFFGLSVIFNILFYYV